MVWAKILIGLVIMLAVVFITALFIAPALYSLYAKFAAPSYETALEETKAGIETNFPALVSRLQKCAAINDNNCICPNVLPGFPAIFPEEAKIKLDAVAHKTAIKLFYGATIIKNAIIKATMAPTEITFEEGKDYPILTEKKVGIRKLIKIIPAPKAFIVSPNIYKGDEYDLNFITSKSEEKKEVEETLSKFDFPECGVKQ